MVNYNVSVTDGRYLVNYPDAVLIQCGYADPFYVSIETWNSLTGYAPIKIYARGQSRLITKECYLALKANRLDNPVKTNNTIPSDVTADTCGHCGGLGHIDAYKHINGGVCFSCSGSGKKQVEAV